MSVVQILLAAEAAKENRAVRRTTYRHFHLAPRPLVVTVYNLSGEAAAPLGFCYGTKPGKPTVVVAAEPRNRESRFGAINTFAEALVKYISPFLELEEIEVGRGDARHLLEVASDAPQLIVPNSATRDFLGARLGRSLRYLGLGKTHDVPEATKWAGAHLSWLAEHTHMPGQSIFPAATEFLGRHFVTGQSELENENLASLLAWIENDPRQGRKLIDAAEDAAYGPVPNPDWEVQLEPLVREWTECERAGNLARRASVEKKVRALVAPKLEEAYEATWRAHLHMTRIPEAPSVSKRWEGDVRSWSDHARRAERGIPRFTRRHDAVRAARMLEVWSRALDALEYREAIDDPLVLAELDAAGRCASGVVAKIDLDNYEVKPGRTNRTLVPLVELKLAAPSILLPGDSVTWTGDDGVKGEIRAMDEARATIAIMAGHNRATRLPALKASAVFASLDLFGGPPPKDPLDVPWTHQLAEVPNGDQQNGGSSQTGAAADGEPDLSPEQLLGLPVTGSVDPESVPGVVL